MRKIAIIPARGGSKRIPRKNIKIFCGKPIIAWAIETAIKSELFDEVMVSTEDEEIEQISKKYGAKVPFIRTSKNADDLAGTEDVILEVLESYRKMGKQFDTVCCIYPTSPLMTINRLIESQNILLEGGHDTVLPVVKHGHPVQRSFKKNGNTINMVWPEYEDYRTQDIEPYFYDAGQYYWMDVKKFQNRKKIFSTNTGFFELSEMEAHDIDNLSDWILAEMKFNLLYKFGLQLEKSEDII